MTALTVAAFYHFQDFPAFSAYRDPLKALMLRGQVKGTILLAPEGINGTISGPQGGVDDVLAFLRTLPGFATLHHKESRTDTHPFGRTKVKLKRELISLGVPANPNEAAGTHVKPAQWNALIAQPDVLLLDTRNAYEVHLGTFKGAVNPNIRTFKDLPAYVAKHLDPHKTPRVATFCTGGIRCEKFASFLRAQGFKDVYQLEGGILQYIEEMPEEDSAWQGECYVFDERVAVDHTLSPSQHASMCTACGHALTAQDRESEPYKAGKACPYCA